jgi:hypothetical protein
MAICSYVRRFGPSPISAPIRQVFEELKAFNPPV